MIDKRMMYAQGQRVAKTLDGSRPGYRGDGGYQGGSGAPGSAESSGGTGNGGTGNGGNGGDNSPGRNQAQYGTPTAPAAPATTPDPRGPSELGVTTRTVNPVVPDLPKEYIGGKPFDVTPDTRGERNRAKELAEIMEAPIPNFTPKGIEYFKDGTLLNNFVPGQDPLNKSKFSVGNLLFNTAFFVANPVLYSKYQKGKRLYSGAKFVANTLSDVTGKNVSKPFQTVENLAKNINLRDKNVIESFKDSLTNNLTSKTRTKNKPESVINIDTKNNNEGITTLENANALQDEYKTLFQKLQTGVITDEEQVRYNMLKNMLGI